jgi:hypothetical protein
MRLRHAGAGQDGGMIRRRLAIATSLAIALAACGSDRSPARSDASSTTTPAESDTRIVRDGMVRLHDLPRDWERVADPPRDLKRIMLLVEQSPACQPFLALTDGIERALRSPRFEGPDETEMVTSVAVFDSAATVDAHAELFSQPGMIGCLTERFQARPPKTASRLIEVDDISISPLGTEDYGDAAYGWRATISQPAPGGPIVTFTDLIGVQVGRAELGFQVTAPEIATAVQLEQKVLPTLVQQLRAAGA